MWNNIYRQVIGIALQAAALTFFFALLFALTIFFVSKIRKKEQRLSFQRWILPCLFLVYLFTVLGLTLFARLDNMGRMDLHLFTSYWNAWNRFTTDAWKMPIYNIVMFVPLGMFLPLLHSRFKKLIWTMLVAFLFTLGIEFTQLLCNTGIFELDDILNNVFGAWIGWGMLMASLRILADVRFRQWSKKTIRDCVLYIFPFWISLSAFFFVIYQYQSQPYGNFENGPTFRHNMKQIELIQPLSLSLEKPEKKVYLLQNYNESLMKKQAEMLIDKMELQNMRCIQSNLDKVVYTSADQVSLTVYANGTLRYETQTTPVASSQSELTDWLKRLDLMLPESLRFNKNGSLYEAVVPFQSNESMALSGNIEMALNEKGDISSLNWNIRLSHPVAEKRLLSEQEAWDKVRSGWFRVYTQATLESLELLDVQLTYIRDTKGYYRPAYEFSVFVNEKSYSQILIPA